MIMPRPIGRTTDDLSGGVDSGSSAQTTAQVAEVNHPDAVAKPKGTPIVWEVSGRSAFADHLACCVNPRTEAGRRTGEETEIDYTDAGCIPEYCLQVSGRRHERARDLAGIVQTARAQSSGVAASEVRE